jgi:hypothetical protein
MFCQYESRFLYRRHDCFGITIKIKPLSFYHDPFHALNIILDDQEGGGECFTAQIKESKYEKVDVKDVVKKQVHLTDKQSEHLDKVLEK